MTIDRYRVSFQGDDNVPELSRRGSQSHPMNELNATESYTLK